MSWIKQRLIGAVVGRTSVAARDLWNFCRSPDHGPMICQDICARRLLPRLSPAGVFVDVGAHIGSVIANVALHNPARTIVAIEPIPEKANWLSKRFPAAQVHCCAVGETEGAVQFFIDAERPGFSSLAKPDEQRVGHEISVAMRRLDDLVSSVDVLKIDVEGAELGVLKSGHDLISRCRPIIYFESGPSPQQATTTAADELFTWFERQGYQIYVPNRVEHDGPALCFEGFRESHYYPFRTLN